MVYVSFGLLLFSVAVAYVRNFDPVQVCLGIWIAFFAVWFFSGFKKGKR